MDRLEHVEHSCSRITHPQTSPPTPCELSDVTALVDFLFLPEPLTDGAAWDKAMKADNAATILDLRRLTKARGSL